MASWLPRFSGLTSFLLFSRVDGEPARALPEHRPAGRKEQGEQVCRPRFAPFLAALLALRTSSCQPMTL